jgi:predicted Zn-dependent protease with MMP-like domain
VSAADRLRAARGVRHRYRTDRRTFERIVGEVVASLPDQFRERFDNVAVVVEEWPDPDAEAEVAGASDDPDGGTDLLGLYHGVPYGQRQTDYNLVLPDRITIYRGPILAASRTEAEAREEIRLTVLHEIGHYFGLGDDELP